MVQNWSETFQIKRSLDIKQLWRAFYNHNLPKEDFYIIKTMIRFEPNINDNYPNIIVAVSSILVEHVLELLQLYLCAKS